MVCPEDVLLMRKMSAVTAFTALRAATVNPLTLIGYRSQMAKEGEWELG
jgi:hypothetical protein